MMEAQPSPTDASISFGDMPEDFVRALFGKPVTVEEHFRVARLQWKIGILNCDIPELRLTLPPFSYVDPPDLLLCQEKYWEYQDMCREDGAANKVAAMLISFEKDHPWEWLCCGWKDEAIAALVLGNLGNVKDGRKAAEGWLKEYWKRKQKEQREREVSASPKRTAARKAVSELHTLQLLDEQERWLETIDPALLDPGDELLELFEKRRCGTVARPSTYSDYADFVAWLHKHRKKLPSKKKSGSFLTAVAEKFRREQPNNVLKDKEMADTCVAYCKIAPRIKGPQRRSRIVLGWVLPPRNRPDSDGALTYPIVLEVVARRHGVSPRLVDTLRAQQNRKTKDNTKRTQTT